MITVTLISYIVNSKVYRLDGSELDTTINFYVKSYYEPPTNVNSTINAYRKFFRNPFYGPNFNTDNPFGIFYNNNRIIIAATYNSRMGLVFTDTMGNSASLIRYIFSGAPIGQFQVGVDAVQTQDSGYILLGYGPFPDTSGLIVLKTDRDGNPICSRIIRAQRRIRPADMVGGVYEDINRNIIIVSTTTSGSDTRFKGIAIKLDQNCNLIEAFLIIGNEHFALTSVIQDDNGYYIMVGSEMASGFMSMAIIRFTPSFFPFNFKYIRTYFVNSNTFSPYHLPRFILREQNDIKIFGYRTENNGFCFGEPWTAQNLFVYSMNGNWIKGYSVWARLAAVRIPMIQSTGKNAVSTNGYIYFPAFYFNPILDCDAGNFDAALIKIQSSNGDIVKHWTFFGADDPQGNPPLRFDDNNIFKNALIRNNSIYINELHGLHGGATALNKLSADTICSTSRDSVFSYDVNYVQSPWCNISDGSYQDLECQDMYLYYQDFTNSLTIYTPNVQIVQVPLNTILDCEINITPVADRENKCKDIPYRLVGKTIELKNESEYSIFSIDGKITLSGKGKSIKITKEGIYILRLNGRSFKILVR